MAHQTMSLLDTPLKAVNKAIIIFVTYFRPSACNRSSSAGRTRVKIYIVPFYRRWNLLKLWLKSDARNRNFISK